MEFIDKRRTQNIIKFVSEHCPIIVGNSIIGFEYTGEEIFEHIVFSDEIDKLFGSVSAKNLCEALKKIIDQLENPDIFYDEDFIENGEMDVYESSYKVNKKYNDYIKSLI